MVPTMDVSRFNFGPGAPLLNIGELRISLPCTVTRCQKLLNAVPGLQPAIDRLRDTVKCVVRYGRNVVPVDLSNVEDHMKTFVEEVGGKENFLSVVDMLHSSSVSGRRLDNFVFRNKEPCIYRVVKVSENNSRLANLEDKDTVEIDMRASLQTLVAQETRKNLDVFARGNIYKVNEQEFTKEQVRLFAWCKKIALIDHCSKIMGTDVRSKSRKRSSAVVDNTNNQMQRAYKR